MTTPDAKSPLAPKKIALPGSNFQHAKVVLMPTLHPRAGFNFRPAKESTPPSVEARAGSTFPVNQVRSGAHTDSVDRELNRVPDPPNDKRRLALADLRVGDTPTTPGRAKHPSTEPRSCRPSEGQTTGTLITKR
jgi:hypothetical protein